MRKTSSSTRVTLTTSTLAPKAAKVGTILLAEAQEKKYDHTLPLNTPTKNKNLVI